MEIKIVSIFESAHTDGYTHFGTGLFFLDRDIAKLSGKVSYGSYAVDPKEHKAIQVSSGKYILVKSEDHVILVSEETERGKIMESIKEKLSVEELKFLGLKKDQVNS